MVVVLLMMMLMAKLGHIFFSTTTSQHVAADAGKAHFQAIIFLFLFLFFFFFHSASSSYCYSSRTRRRTIFSGTAAALSEWWKSTVAPHFSLTLASHASPRRPRCRQRKTQSVAASSVLSVIIKTTRSAPHSARDPPTCA